MCTLVHISAQGVHVGFCALLHDDFEQGADKSAQRVHNGVHNRVHMQVHMECTGVLPYRYTVQRPWRDQGEYSN